MGVETARKVLDPKSLEDTFSVLSSLDDYLRLPMVRSLQPVIIDGSLGRPQYHKNSPKITAPMNNVIKVAHDDGMAIER